MMYIYKYEIQYYNEIEEKSEEKMGLLAAATYEDAMSRIAQYYRDDTISHVHLEVLDDIVEIRSIVYE